MLFTVIFFVILAIIAAAFRFGAEYYYSKITGEVKVKSKQKPVEKDDIPEEIVTAISAAVYSCCESQVVIKKIKFANADSDQAWIRAGRQSIMTSHSVGTNKLS